MTDKPKAQLPQTLGDDPFVDMGDLAWLGVESLPESEEEIAPKATTNTAEEGPAPETTVSPETDALTSPPLPDDEAERALQAWLHEETPIATVASTAENVLDIQNALLTRLTSEQSLPRENS